MNKPRTHEGPGIRLPQSPSSTAPRCLDIGSDRTADHTRQGHNVIVCTGRDGAMEDGGYYTYEIDTKGVNASIETSIVRKYMIDMLPFPVGAIFLAYGLYQRNESEEEPDEVLDAELDA